MKKTLLLAGAAFLASSISAQILTEDFEGGSLPNGWLVTSNAPNNAWDVGTAANLGSSYFPFTGNSTNFIGSNDDAADGDHSNDFVYTSAVDLTAETT